VHLKLQSKNVEITEGKNCKIKETRFLPIENAEEEMVSMLGKPCPCGGTFSPLRCSLICFWNLAAS
jgi:hypothetical protein